MYRNGIKHNTEDEMTIKLYIHLLYSTQYMCIRAIPTNEFIKCFVLSRGLYFSCCVPETRSHLPYCLPGGNIYF